jgi:hypothetical protein
MFKDFDGFKMILNHFPINLLNLAGHEKISLHDSYCFEYFNGDVCLKLKR